MLCVFLRVIDTSYRADPTATGDDHRPAKIIAVENDSMEVVDVLWEALGEEVPEKVRLQQLSRAMYKEDKEEGRKRFRELLSYLTPDMVRFLNRNQSFNEFVIIQVTATPVNRYGSVLQDAVVEGKTEFVRLLLKHGYVLCIQKN